MKWMRDRFEWIIKRTIDDFIEFKLRSSVKKSETLLINITRINKKIENFLVRVEILEILMRAKKNFREDFFLMRLIFGSIQCDSIIWVSRE